MDAEKQNPSIVIVSMISIFYHTQVSLGPLHNYGTISILVSGMSMSGMLHIVNVTVFNLYNY